MSELTLVEFLTQRLDEDEAVTVTSKNGSGRTWTEPKYVLHDHDCMFLWAVESSDRTCECDGEKRWLVEVQAKRAIVEAVASGFYDSDLEVALRLLASVFSDHPDYRQEWTP